MTDVAAKATRREWIGLGVIALPCLLYSMDLTVLNLAVPHLTADLRPSAAQLLWIVDIYGFLIAGALITMGTLGDRIGRRRLLLIGAAAFGAASVLAAFANSAAMLIAARALLGLAGATLAPSTLSLLRNMFHDPRERTTAIGVWIASFSAGGAIGPLFGGLLLEHFWWGSVFLANVPVMALLLVLGPLLLPEFRDPDAGRLDLASAALSLAAVLAVIYGLKHIAESGADAVALAAIAVGLVVGALFLRRQRRLDDPLVDLRLFRVPAFSASLAVNVVAFFVAFATFLFVAQYLQLVLGLRPLQAGLWTATSGVAFVVGSMLAPLIVRRVRPAYVLAGGLTLASTGFALLTQVGTRDGLPVLIGGYVLLSLGLAPVVTLTTDLIVGSVPPERAGQASGLSETSSEFGGALGIALLGSLATALYRGAMADAMPAELPTDAIAAARATLGGAVAAAGALPDAHGAELLAAARQAFVQAFRQTAMVSAGVALAAAMVAAVMLRGLRIGGDETAAAST
jgi:MFS transporter, DHA2 family, multidrug resistance protein